MRKDAYEGALDTLARAAVEVAVREGRMQLQETLEQYDAVLDSLRSEYEAGLAEGVRLPPFDALTRPVLGDL